MPAGGFGKNLAASIRAFSSCVRASTAASGLRRKSGMSVAAGGAQLRSRAHCTGSPLTDFDCFSFDCYGTLVDWEGSIHQALAPLYTKLPDDHPLRYDRDNLLKAFIQNEGITYGRLAEELGVAASKADKAAFGLGVGDWPIYPDTADALKRLQKHFKLVILSNVKIDNSNLTLAKQFKDVKFDAVYTAEDIGSYKPDARNFEYLITHCREHLGIPSEEIIHVAQALFHDQVSTRAARLATPWIERGEDVPSAIGGNLEEFADKGSFSWRFKNMGEMADAFEGLKDKTKFQASDSLTQALHGIRGSKEKAVGSAEKAEQTQQELERCLEESETREHEIRSACGIVTGGARGSERTTKRAKDAEAERATAQEDARKANEEMDRVIETVETEEQMRVTAVLEAKEPPRLVPIYWKGLRKKEHRRKQGPG
ncbi:Haloacid dehalogenase-like hydrolase-domain-containing protein [Xylariales sp. AK1849]|nr:Haloacid dehalogenase-like hydrolase-domain-containing protein [Xylariales sp. AK1849]